jgi:hypothetical protein
MSPEIVLRIFHLAYQGWAGVPADIASPVGDVFDFVCEWLTTDGLYLRDSVWAGLVRLICEVVGRLLGR